MIAKYDFKKLFYFFSKCFLWQLGSVIIHRAQVFNNLNWRLEDELSCLHYVLPYHTGFATVSMPLQLLRRDCIRDIRAAR
jgi:hypothetical protein